MITLLFGIFSSFFMSLGHTFDALYLDESGKISYTIPFANSFIQCEIDSKNCVDNVRNFNANCRELGTLKMFVEDYLDSNFRNHNQAIVNILGLSSLCKTGNKFHQHKEDLGHEECNQLKNIKEEARTICFQSPGLDGHPEDDIPAQRLPVQAPANRGNNKAGSQ